MIRIKRDDELSWRDFTIYFGDKQGSRFIGFHFPLHSGWQSYPKWMPGGWEYYDCAFLTGRLNSNQSRWWGLPHIIIPAKLVKLWRLRKKSWRQAYKEKPIEAAPTSQEGSEDD